MVFNTNFSRLNFHYEEIYKTIIDKRNGLKISMGLCSGLRGSYAQYQNVNKGFTLCFQEQGMAQNELDSMCGKMVEQAQSLGINILATKSDLPFDNRWFILGDIRKLIESAQQDKIFMPLSNFLYDSILVEFEAYEDIK